VSIFCLFLIMFSIQFFHEDFINQLMYNYSSKIQKCNATLFLGSCSSLGFDYDFWTYNNHLHCLECIFSSWKNCAEERLEIFHILDPCVTTIRSFNLIILNWTQYNVNFCWGRLNHNSPNLWNIIKKEVQIKSWNTLEINLIWLKKLWKWLFIPKVSIIMNKICIFILFFYFFKMNYYIFD